MSRKASAIAADPLMHRSPSQKLDQRSSPPTIAHFRRERDSKYYTTMGSGPSSLKRRDSLDSLGSMRQSPSAAFGRLRIDSPRQHKVPPLRHRNLSHGDLQHSEFSMVDTTLSLSPKFLPGEKTPLFHQTSGQSPRELRSHHHYHEDLVKGSPPLAVWIVPALLCALSYAFYNIFIKKGSASIHPILGGVILQFVAAILGTVLLIFIIVRDGGVEDLDWDWDGVQWSVCAGLAVGLAEMISFFVSSLGVQAMQSIPILIGGSVMFGTILGLCLLGEVLSYHGWLGVILLISGICLVATDPAATNALGH